MLRQKNNSYTKGIGLIELLVAIAAGMVIIGGTIAVFLGILKSNAESIKVARLNHELRTAMIMMTADVRRAGYWSQSIVDVYQNTNSNPFLAAANDLQISPDNSCILFSYDSNSDGILPALNTAGGDKRFGYRVRNQVLQMRPLSHTTFSCADADNVWEDITSPDILQITNANIFAFTPNPAIDLDVNGVSTLTLRRLSVALTGELTDDATISRTFTQAVRVRNDKFNP